MVKFFGCLLIVAFFLVSCTSQGTIASTEVSQELDQTTKTATSPPSPATSTPIPTAEPTETPTATPVVLPLENVDIYLFCNCSEIVSLNTDVRLHFGWMTKTKEQAAQMPGVTDWEILIDGEALTNADDLWNEEVMDFNQDPNFSYLIGWSYEFHTSELGPGTHTFEIKQTFTDNYSNGVRDFVPNETRSGRFEITVVGPEGIVDAEPTRTDLFKHVKFLEDGWKAEIVRRAGIIPWQVTIGPNDEVLVIGQYEDTIYRVEDNGDLSVYAIFPGMQILYINFDPSGTLYFSAGMGRKIYRVNEFGIPKLVAQNVNRFFEFDSSGNLIAGDHSFPGIQEIKPGGTVSALAPDDVIVRSLAVGPQDEIVWMDHDGNLLQLLPQLEYRTVASGLPLEIGIEFAPDGTLYGLDWTGLFAIDLETGEVTKQSWFDRFSNNGNGFDFDSQGNMVTFHPNHPIFKVSLAEETSEMLYHPRGNTTTMALDPEGEIYLAYGDQLPSGETVLYHLGAQGDLEEVMRLAYGEPLAIAFDGTGQGYISLSDRQKGETIISFDPDTGTNQEYTQMRCYPQSIAVDPVTDNLWWVSCDDVYYRDESGEEHIVAFPDGSSNKYIFFGQDGALYAILWFGSYGGADAMPHGVFRLQPDGTWVELADLTNDDPFITWAMGAACPDGTIYTVTHMDVQTLGIQGIGTLNAVLRVEPNGDLTTIAGGFPVDAFTVLCEPKTGDLLFTTIEAIFRLSKGE
jgi:hypothetical protein